MSVVLRGCSKPSDCDLCVFQTNGYCHALGARIEVEHGTDPRCPITEIIGYTLPNGHKVVISLEDGVERHEVHLKRKTDCPWK